MKDDITPCDDRNAALFNSLFAIRHSQFFWKRPGLSSSWGTLVYVPCSQTPAGPPRQARNSPRSASILRRVGAAFRFWYSVGSRESVLSRLHGTARTPAVYASQGESLRHHARLASGRWPGFAGQDAASCKVPTKGFNCMRFRSVHRIPLSQAFLTQAKQIPCISGRDTSGESPGPPET